MAKQDRDDKAKVRFVFLEIEGGSNALQETVRSFAATLARPAPVRAVLPETVNGNGAPPIKGPKAGAEFQEIPPPQPSLFPLENEEAEQDEPATPSRPKVQRFIPKPQVVPLDLTSGQTPLAAYCAQKNPDTEIKKYLVITAWLKEFRARPTVTMNEIFTCYRHMNWPVPPDPGQPLRDLKNKRQWIDKADGKGAYSINHLGENEVAKMGASA